MDVVILYSQAVCHSDFTKLKNCFWVKLTLFIFFMHVPGFIVHSLLVHINNFIFQVTYTIILHFNFLILVRSTMVQVVVCGN